MKIKLVLRTFIWLIAVFALVGGTLVSALPPSASAEASAEAEGEMPFDVRFTGVIVTVGGASQPWTIGPQTVATDANTKVVFNGLPDKPGEPGGSNPPVGIAAPGQWADVDAQRQTNGSLLAKIIHVRPETVQLRGIVSDKPTIPDSVGDWTIAGVTVKVTADTKLGTREGPINVGNWVEAVMTEDNDVLTAVRILKIDDRDEVEVTGAIQSFAKDKWVLSAIPLTLDANTTVVGDPALGLIAHAAAKLQTDGSLVAARLQVMWNEKPGSKPGRPVPVNFNGTVEKLPDTGLWGDWVVAGKTVIVAPGTRINQQKGLVKVGADVNVIGTQTDGKIMAMQITVLKSDAAGGRRVVFVGRIEALPLSGVVGAWKIGGREVTVTSQTILLPRDVTPKLGAWALVEGLRPETGPIVASQIRLAPAGPRALFNPAETPELTEE
jgi:hypothetical protein